MYINVWGKNILLDELYSQCNINTYTAFSELGQAFTAKVKMPCSLLTLDIKHIENLAIDND